MTVLVRHCLIAALLATSSYNVAAFEESATGDATVIVTADGEIQKQADGTLDDLKNATTTEEEQAVQSPGAAFGVVQLISTEEVDEETDDFDESAVLSLLEETAKYITEIVHQDESYADVCLNYNAMCTIWATQGECEENGDYMLEECAPACQSCDQLSVADCECEADCESEEFGVRQVLDNSDIPEEDQNMFDEAEVMRHLEETKAYMATVNLSTGDNDEEQVESDCYNSDAFCTFWATLGECTKNPDFMLVECAPSCKSCDHVSSEMEEGPGSDYGVVQITDPTKFDGSFDVDLATVLQKLQATDEYMAALQQQDPEDEDEDDEDEEACVNHFAMCTIWAVTGRCEMQPDIMSEEVSSRKAVCY
jgi:hypothetical protein